MKGYIIVIPHSEGLLRKFQCYEFEGTISELIDVSTTSSEIVVPSPRAIIFLETEDDLLQCYDAIEEKVEDFYNTTVMSGYIDFTRFKNFLKDVLERQNICYIALCPMFDEYLYFYGVIMFSSKNYKCLDNLVIIGDVTETESGIEEFEIERIATKDPIPGLEAEISDSVLRRILSKESIQEICKELDEYFKHHGRRAEFYYWELQY